MMDSCFPEQAGGGRRRIQLYFDLVRLVLCQVGFRRDETNSIPCVQGTDGGLNDRFQGRELIRRNHFTTRQFDDFIKEAFFLCWLGFTWTKNWRRWLRFPVSNRPVGIELHPLKVDDAQQNVGCENFLLQIAESLFRDVVFSPVAKKQDCLSRMFCLPEQFNARSVGVINPG